MKTMIAIVGAGPVGLSLAIDLAVRGVEVTLVDEREARSVPTVRCNHIASRTMEAFRRWGIAGRIRDCGLPADHPADVVFRPVATREDFARIPIPSRQDRYTDTSGADGWWPTPEPPHRCNQIFFEPLLFDHAASLPGITILSRRQVTAFAQDEDAVTLHFTDCDSGERDTLEAAYLVGCDGARSLVRKGIGARFEGDAEIQKVQSTYFRAPALVDLIPDKPGWMTYLYHPVRAGNLLAIDGRETWLLHNYLLPGETDFEQVDRDACLRMVLGVDEGFEYEVLGNEDWIGRRLVADRFRDRRVFIAGDSAHIWVPYAGYGMNAGIADALDLSWMLAARLQGWGGEALLDAYEAERMPITDQVSRFAMDHAGRAISERTQVPAAILDHTAEGERVRDRLGRQAEQLHVRQFACAGLNFGYFYDASPVIIGDGERAPDYSMSDYTPSTVPGCRVPHFFLGDGTSLYDAMQDGFVLLRLDPDIRVAGIVLSAADRAMPLQVLDIDTGIAPDAYRHALVLVRPDRHIAWRGDEAPADPDCLVATVTGWNSDPATDRPVLAGHCQKDGAGASGAG